MTAPIDTSRARHLSPSVSAGIAQLVEHELPKLRVAGSNPVSRSKNASAPSANDRAGAFA